MVRIHALSEVVHGVDTRLVQTKDNKIGICRFSAIKHAALWSKSKDWLSQIQENVS
jgi:hypothetical protein